MLQSISLPKCSVFKSLMSWFNVLGIPDSYDRGEIWNGSSYNYLEMIMIGIECWSEQSVFAALCVVAECSSFLQSFCESQTKSNFDLGDACYY